MIVGMNVGRLMQKAGCRRVDKMRIISLVPAMVFLVSCTEYVPKDAGDVIAFVPELYEPTKFVYQGIYASDDTNSFIYSIKTEDIDLKVTDYLQKRAADYGWEKTDEGYFVRFGKHRYSSGDDYLVARLEEVDRDEALLGVVFSSHTPYYNHKTAMERFYNEKGNSRYGHKGFWSGPYMRALKSLKHEKGRGSSKR